MKNFTLLIAFLLLLFQLNAQSEKIIGGEEIDISDAPYIVSLEIDGDEHQCGGVIIDCEWILTAAHCVFRTPDILEDIIVHAGSTNQTDQDYGQRVGVAEVIRHPMAMNQPINGFDLALIKLKEPLIFGNNTQPIAFATPDNTSPADFAPGVEAFISGWGYPDNSSSPSDVLRGVSIPIISTALANSILPPNSKQASDDFHITVFNPNTGAANKDSGGPAIIEVDGEPMLIGIASWTLIPYGDFPTAYVNVRNFTDFITDNITINECESCADFALDYQLVDDKGNPKTMYCPGDEVTVDVLEILDTDEYHIDLWIEDKNGELDWISGEGWEDGETPDGIEVIDFFENDPENPVTFEPGVNYVLKIAVSTPLCGWMEVLQPFSFYKPFIEPADYIFQDADGNEKTTFCVGEDIWVDGSPTIGEDRYEIYAWRVLDNGDKVWFGNLGSFSVDMAQVNISQSFANLGVPRYFDPGTYLLSVAYYSNVSCVGRTLVEKKFIVECCQDYLDASFSAVATVLTDNRYRLKVNNYEYYHNHEVVHEWYLMSQDDGSIIASSVGGFIYNNAEFGKNYFLIHKIRTPCGEFCYVLGISYQEGGPFNSFGGDFDCSIVDLECAVAVPKANLNCGSGIINWNPIANADSYVLRIYYDQGECCGTALGQPDAVINLSYSEYSFYAQELADAKCVTYQVGVRCAGETSWGPLQCKECCTGDKAPEDIKYNCLTNQGSFSPVIGAEGYVVQVIYGDRDCFCPDTGKETTETVQLGEEDTRFNLNLQARCLSIRVGAKCQGTVVWSAKECIDCFDVMPKFTAPSLVDGSQLTILPNVAAYQVKLQVESANAVNGMYNIHSSNGTLIDQQKGSSLELDLDISNYPVGIYFVTFIAESGNRSTVQRLIVTR